MGAVRRSGGVRPITVRGKAEYLGGTRFRFVCPRGHLHIKDMAKGPVTKRLTESACAALAGHWAHQGINFECKVCTVDRAREMSVIRFEVFLKRDESTKKVVEFVTQPSHSDLHAEFLSTMRPLYGDHIEMTHLDFRRLS